MGNNNISLKNCVIEFFDGAAVTLEFKAFAGTVEYTDKHTSSETRMDKGAIDDDSGEIEGKDEPGKATLSDVWYDTSTLLTDVTRAEKFVKGDFSGAVSVNAANGGMAMVGLRITFPLAPGAATQRRVTFAKCRLTPGMSYSLNTDGGNKITSLELKHYGFTESAVTS